MVKETKDIETKEVERWNVQLAIVDENTPPKKLIVDTEAPEEQQQYDLTAAVVKVLNNQEKLMKLLD